VARAARPGASRFVSTAAGRRGNVAMTGDAAGLAARATSYQCNRVFNIQSLRLDHLDAGAINSNERTDARSIFSSPANRPLT